MADKAHIGAQNTLHLHSNRVPDWDIMPGFRHENMTKEPRVTVKIPRPLYRRIQQVIETSGFSSPTDFIVFVLRDLVSEVETKDDQEYTAEELQVIRQKLKNLGYL